MSINISVLGSPISIRRKKLFISDIETLKKNEVNRRRRLRLEQVRQQSKDIASQIRQRVRGEADRQLNEFERKQRAALNKMQARRLLSLQQQYQDCLEEIGMGHADAALQPDAGVILEAERQLNRSLAEERGREAAAKLRQDQADEEDRRKAAREQYKFSRTREDLRSAVLVSLARKSQRRTPKKRKVKKKKKSVSESTLAARREEQPIYPPPPPKAWTIPLEKEPRPGTSRAEEVEESERRRAAAAAVSGTEASGSSDGGREDDLHLGGLVSSSSSSSFSSSSTSQSSVVEVDRTSRVRLYDHGTRYESQYDQHSTVERVGPCSCEPDANEAAEEELQAASRVVFDEALHSRMHSRSNQALARERLHRDYKQLLGDLHTLAREERLIRSTREHGLPAEAYLEDYRRKELDSRRQRNMDSAFESIYHSSKQDSPSRPASPDVSPTEEMPPRWESVRDGTPAKLNVAEYSPLRTLNVNAAVPQTCAATTSEQPGACSAQVAKAHRPACQPLDTTTSRPEAPAGHVSTLEDLMQRVNEQRALLLGEIRTSAPPPVSEHSSPPRGMDAAAKTSRRSPERRSEHSSPPQGTDAAAKTSKRSPERRRQQLKKPSSPVHESPTRDSGEHSRVYDTVDARKMSPTSRKAARHEDDRRSKAIKIKSRTTCKCNKTAKDKRGKKEDECVCVSDEDGLNSSTTQVREVHSEYSYEHSIVESSLGSSASTSTSYEGVKIIVSVAELTEKTYSVHSPKGKKAVPAARSPQKGRKGHGRNICKRRHKTPEKPHEEPLTDKESKGKSPRKQRKQARSERDVQEKGTMTLNEELTKPAAPPRTSDSTSVEEKATQSSSKTEDDKKWGEVLDKSLSSGKESSGASTSYMSPPEEILSSNIEYLAPLLALIKQYQKKQNIREGKMNPLLVHYISRLLGMSRESIENLGVSTSDISTPELDSSSAESIAARPTRPEQRARYDTPQDKAVIDSLINAVKQKTKTMPHRCSPCSDHVHSVPGTSTPEEEEEPRQSQPAHRFEMVTPTFASNIADMSLDEYKAFKFPEIFSDYSERCTRRISSLSKRIEEIRDERRRLLTNLSGNSSSSSGSSGFNSTKYISPPESSAVMTRVMRTQPPNASRGKENVVPTSPVKSPRKPDAKHSPDRGKSSTASSRQHNVAPTMSVYFTPPESLSKLSPVNVNSKGTKSPPQRLAPSAQEVLPSSSQSLYQTPVASFTDATDHVENVSPAQLSSGSPQRNASPHCRAPCATEDTEPPQHSRDQEWRETRADESTRIAVPSGAPLTEVCGFCPRNCDPNRCASRDPRPHTRPPSSSLRHNVQSAENGQVKELSTIIEADTSMMSASSGRGREHEDTDSSIPDVMSEMLLRRLVTSPLPWTRDTSPPSTDSSPRNSSDSFTQTYFFTYLGAKSNELTQFLRGAVEKISRNRGEFHQKVAEHFSKLGKNPTPGEIELAFRKLGLKWTDRNACESLRPALVSRDINPTSQAFQKRVEETFNRLSIDSAPSELKAAFQKIGVVCPGGCLQRCDNCNSMSLSPSTAQNSFDPSTSTGSSVLPPLPTSLSLSTEDFTSPPDS